MTTKGANWDPAKHPRHPAGSSQGGEWAKVEAWWKATRPDAPMPVGPAQEMHALAAYRKAKHLPNQFREAERAINRAPRITKTQRTNAAELSAFKKGK